MLFKTILNSSVDSALWGNPGRIPAIYATSDDSHIVIATDCRLTNPGSDDLTKGDDFRIGFMVSTDGGTTFSTLDYAIDEHLTVDATGTGIGFTDPCLVPDGAGNLYLFATSDKDAPAGTGPGTGSGRASIAYSVATLAGDFADWSAVTYIPVFTDMETNNAFAGTGYYDDASDTMVLPFGGYITDRWTPQPLYKTGGGAWTRSTAIPVISAAPDGEGEHKIVLSDDGYWYCLTRNNDAAPNSYRHMYRAASIAGPWEAVPNVGRLHSVTNNFGLCRTTIGGTDVWLYSGSDYPTTQVGETISNTANARRTGRLKISVDQGRSWHNAAMLTHGDGANSSNSFFGYSCVVASDANIYVLFESNNYTTMRLCKIAKSELSITL